MAGNKIIDAMWDDSPIDVSREVNFIWSIANKLRGPYKSDKYKDVIIPMTIIRRFECALAPTKSAVVKLYGESPSLPTKAFCKAACYSFYNTSPYTLHELLNDPDNIADNLRSYISGFSPNVREIIASLDFDKDINKMNTNNRLFGVVKAFSELDLDPVAIDNMKMGYIFEELIRKFSENAEAGDHYTGRDIIKLMVSILLAEMLIKGQDAENVRLQDTMKADCFPAQKMRFVIENPPFGQPWGGKDAAEGVEDAVRAEYENVSGGRWSAGLPGTSDMQLLFIQSAIDKLDDEVGRAAVIENGSPLFTGDTGSGESQIRRWLLENDLIEAIIALPHDLFYNTGIATYIWVMSKNKRPERRGYVQLIDASEICHKLRKSLGNKRNEITPEDRAEITRLYADFKECERVKIFPNTEFIYREYAVMQPLQRNYAVTAERIERLRSSRVLDTIYSPSKVREFKSTIASGEELDAKSERQLAKFRDNEQTYRDIFARLEAAQSDALYKSPKKFAPVLKTILGDAVDKKLLPKIADALSEMDKTAEIQRDKDGSIIYDKATKDAEYLRWDEDIDEYMAREVLPFVPDAKAFFEEDLSKAKPVIKTGAEIPFMRYFYKFKELASSDELAKLFVELDEEART